MFCNYMCPGGGFKAGLGRLAERDPQGEAWLGRHLRRLTGQRPAGRVVPAAPRRAAPPPAALIEGGVPAALVVPRQRVRHQAADLQGCEVLQEILPPLGHGFQVTVAGDLQNREEGEEFRT